MGLQKAISTDTRQELILKRSQIATLKKFEARRVIPLSDSITKSDTALWLLDHDLIVKAYDVVFGSGGQANCFKITDKGSQLLLRQRRWTWSELRSWIAIVVSILAIIISIITRVVGN